jgi:hypothetical protein
MKQLKIAIKELDEVAPQRGIPIFRSIDRSPTKYGRVFIPGIIKKGWLKSHSEGSYEWIFNDLILNEETDGHIKIK